MIPDENIGLIEAARAIVAGRRVDWAAIESSGTVSDSLKALLDELKIVADIAALHRSLVDPASASALASGSESAVSSLGAETVATPPDSVAWGSLRLLERVGEGAFGDVYRAWDPRLDREVALKLLRRPDSQHDSVGSLVVDEGRLLARVRHSNVVTVYGADRLEDRVGLWMEFVHGRTLEAVLRDHGPFGAQEAGLIGLDVCRALSAVHRAGLIHRDIKAHNVMREAGGRIVLMDFGTGRENLGDRHAELAGTPLYLAPEVFAGRPATARSDIYSVGVLLYHLATGSYPVKGRTVADLREGHAARRRAWLRDERPDLPDRFVLAVERALAVDPDERYESAGAMEAALARVVSASDAIDVAAAEPSSSAAAQPRDATASTRRWLSAPWRIAAVAAALGAATVVTSSTWRAKIVDRLGGSPPARSASATPTDSSVVVRKITLPDKMTVGSPSPDGTLFSYADSAGNVAVVELATGAVRRVTSDAVLEKDSQYAEFSAISPDNQFVAYAWCALDGKWELRIADIEGKRPRVLLRNDALLYPTPLHWSRDGKSILATLERPDHSIQIALVSVGNGAVRGVKEMGTVRPRYASLSPDEELVVYDAPQTPSASARDVFIVRADGSDDRRLIEDAANDANPVWTPDGGGILFASDRSGTMDIWGVAIDRASAQGEPYVVHRNIGRMNLHGLTDTGSYFFNAVADSMDVYQAPVTAQGVGTPEKLPIAYTGSNLSSIWSPDGRRLAYSSRRGLIGFDRGSSTLVVRDMSTGEERDFVPALTGFLVRSWSPDGRSVLVAGTDTAGKAVRYAVDTETGRATSLVPGPTIVRPDWRPDGRLVYYDRSKGLLLAHNVQTDGEERIADLRAVGIDPLSNFTGRGFALGPDGRTLAYTTLDDSTAGVARILSIKVIGGGPPRELVRAVRPELLMFQDWTPDGESLLFTRWTKASEPASLWRVSIHGGEPQAMGLSSVGVREVSVHPDGTKITFTAGWNRSELWVMENFLPNK